MECIYPPAPAAPHPICSVQLSPCNFNATNKRTSILLLFGSVQMMSWRRNPSYKTITLEVVQLRTQAGATWGHCYRSTGSTVRSLPGFALWQSDQVCDTWDYRCHSTDCRCIVWVSVGYFECMLRIWSCDTCFVSSVNCSDCYISERKPWKFVSVLITPIAY